MKLSIVIINWNDKKVLPDCLESIYKQTSMIDFEVIISDNGSTDDSLEFVNKNYPQAIIIENKENLGFARGNNSGIEHATGEYILILNPDTIILDHALDKFVAWADKYPEAGAFGLKVLNPDGSFQNCARPFPTVWRYWIAAIYLRFLARASTIFYSDVYVGWKGDTEREIDWQSGCCVMFRKNALEKAGVFDPRFFYHFEEVDLCFRIHKQGLKILYTPDSSITHLGGQSVGRYPIRFELEKLRNRYRYFHKHYGISGAMQCKSATIAYFRIRQIGYGCLSLFKKSEPLKNRLEMYCVVLKWNKGLDIEKFIESGKEPDVGFEPLGTKPKAL
jgi:GT2 family glycosyltransferase